jgi:hypothetical protein
MPIVKNNPMNCSYNFYTLAKNCAGLFRRNENADFPDVMEKLYLKSNTYKN